MTTSRDPDRLIEAFFEEGVDELPDRAFQFVRSRTEQTRQRVVLGPWRAPDMNRLLMLGGAAAAVLIVAIVAGLWLQRPGGNVGSGPTASPRFGSPSSAAATAPALAPEPEPTTGATSAGAVQRLPRSAGPPHPLEPGTYLTPEGFEPPVAVTVPGGWFGGAGSSGFGVGQGNDEVNQRFGDVGLYLDAIRMPYDDAVAAFRRLEGVSLEAEPVDGTIGGYEATIFRPQPVREPILLDPIVPRSDLTSEIHHVIFIDVRGTTVFIKTEVFDDEALPVLEQVIDSIQFPG